MSAQDFLPRRVITVADVIEDWGLGWHLGRVVECIYQDGLKGTAIDDLREARWFLERKIEHMAEGMDELIGCSVNATIDIGKLLDDWKLPRPLGHLLIVFYCHRAHDVSDLCRALAFLDQRIGAVSVQS